MIQVKNFINFKKVLGESKLKSPTAAKKRSLDSSCPSPSNSLLEITNTYVCCSECTVLYWLVDGVFTFFSLLCVCPASYCQCGAG